MARPISQEINQPFIRPAEPGRSCDHPGCAGDGAHRAPMSRDRLDQYYWFCLDHVRDYNRAWDFYKGMNADDIERQRRHDTVWQRPTWPFTHSGEREQAPRRYRVHDGFGFFWEDEPGARPGKPQTEGQKALAVLDLAEPVTLDEVKRRYKILVKRFHPDANGGDREAEERLKLVNQAYSTLKMSFASPVR